MLKYMNLLQALENVLYDPYPSSNTTIPWVRIFCEKIWKEIIYNQDNLGITLERALKLNKQIFQL